MLLAIARRFSIRGLLGLIVAVTGCDSLGAGDPDAASPTDGGGEASPQQVPPSVDASGGDASGDGGVLLTTGSTATFAIAVDAKYLYFASLAFYSGSNLVIARMAKDGGAVTSLATVTEGGMSFPSNLVLDGTNVYFTFGNAAMKAPLLGGDGGAPSILATVPGPTVTVAIDPTTLYFTNSSAVFSVPIAGGDLRTLLTFGAPSQAGGLAVDTSNVYAADGENSIVSTSLDAGPEAGTTTLVRGQAMPGWLAVDAERIYWVNRGSGGSPPLVGVGSAPLDGGPATLLAPQASPGYGGPVRLTDTKVYWSDGWHVNTVAKTGGPITQLGSLTAEEQADGWTITDLAVDDAHVYWTFANQNVTGGGVMMHSL